MSAANLRAAYEKASESERHDGRLYYRLQRRQLVALGQKYGFSLEQSAGSFAALSPLSKESDTYVATEKCMSWVSSGARGEPPSVTLVGNRTKALAILRGKDPTHVLKHGPKVLSFFQNTLNPENPLWVTVDGHLVSAWTGARLRMKGEAGISRRLYERIHSDAISVAREVSIIPCQLQSTIWLVQRRLNRRGDQYVFDFDFQL